MFPKVKNVNVESPKKRSKLLVFSARLLFLSSPRMLMNGFITAAFIFWGARIDFVWNTKRAKCSEINGTINETIYGH